MLWDDIATPWDRLTIIQCETSWAICAEAEWPDGKQSAEALFNLTLAGVIEAIGKRGPYVGQVVWRTPEERKEVAAEQSGTRYFNPMDQQYHPYTTAS